MAPVYWIMIAVLAGFAGLIFWVIFISLGSGRRKRETKKREDEAMAAVIARHRLDEAFVNLDEDVFVGFAAADGKLFTGSCTGSAESYRLDQIGKVAVELRKPLTDSFAAHLTDMISLGESVQAPIGDPNRTAAINLRISLTGDAEPSLVIPFFDETKSFLYRDIIHERTAAAKHFRERLSQVRAGRNQPAPGASP